MKSLKYTYCVLLVIVCLTFGSCVDETLSEFASGSAVVEAVCNRIESSCIFNDDKTFLRRIAYMETTDGSDNKTFTSSSYKGIWRINSEMFNSTKSFPSVFLDLLLKKLKVDWTNVSWADLQKPLYSGIAARMLLLLPESMIATIPRDLGDQARYWKSYYNTNGNETEFVSKVAGLKDVCNSGAADVTFLVDSSAMIGQENFQTMKTFVINLIEMLNIGPNPKFNTRVTVILFSEVTQTYFPLFSYVTLNQYKEAINSMIYLNQTTNTHLALKYLVTTVVKKDFGTRPLELGIPKVAVILTSSVSSNTTLTLLEAEKAKEAGYNMIAIGIGTNVNDGELTAIASEPVCQNKILINSFEELEIIKNTIKKQICDAPINIIPSENTTFNILLTSAENRNCMMKASKEGVTIDLNTTSEGMVTLYLSEIVHPTPVIYDRKLEATRGMSAVLFLTCSDTTECYIYCNIYVQGDTLVDALITVKPGNQDICKTKNPCQNGGNCENVPNGQYKCTCLNPYFGEQCEQELDICTHKKPCKNNGYCLVKRKLEYTCLCSPYYTGKNCETITDACKILTPCKNGGKCISRSNGEYKCVCSESFFGDNCEKEVDVCTRMSLCRNHGTCTNSSGSKYECRCKSGYSGKNCENKVKDDHSNDKDVYSCHNKNHCTPHNISGKKFFFPHRRRN